MLIIFCSLHLLLLLSTKGNALVQDNLIPSWKWVLGRHTHEAGSVIARGDTRFGLLIFFLYLNSAMRWLTVEQHVGILS